MHKETGYYMSNQEKFSFCPGMELMAEILALRQQLAILNRTAIRPSLRFQNRLFWVTLAQCWQDWRSVLLIVKPETVINQRIKNGGSTMIPGLRRISFRIIGVGLAGYLITVTCPAPQHALTADDYARAEKFMNYNTAPLALRTGVRPTWIADERFWYRVATENGNEFILVDPARGTRGAEIG